MKYVKQHQQREEGIMAVVVTVIMILIITITVLGFSRVSRRETRQSLDRQLTAAASYAAESGINDAVAAIKSGAFNVDTPKTTCASDANISPAPAGQNIVLPTGAASVGLYLGGITSSAQYTCVLVKSTVPTLEYSSILSTDSVTSDFTVTDANGNAVNPTSIVFSWRDSNNQHTYWPNGQATTFPPTSGWTVAEPILRLDLTDITAAGGYARDSMINKTYTGYFYPRTAITSTTPDVSTFNSFIGDANRGVIVSGANGNCTYPVPAGDLHFAQDCNVTINTSGTSSKFLMHLKSIYGSSRVTVRALDSLGKTLYIKGGQILIDSTGQAADVVKRQQVRIPLIPTTTSDNAIQTADSICKRIFTDPTNTIIDSTVSGADAIPGTGACSP